MFLPRNTSDFIFDYFRLLSRDASDFIDEAVGMKLQTTLQLALQSGDYSAIYSVLENHSLGANWRDVTHDLQSIVMKLYYVKLSGAEVIQLYDVILEKDPDLNLLFHIW